MKTSTPVRVLLMLTVPTTLFFLSVGPSGTDYVLAQRDVARVSLAEAQLRADILEMEVGFQRDDDVVDHDLLVLEDAASELHAQAHVRAEDTVWLDRLLGIVRREAEVVESFKTDCAVLQNSKTYFDVLGQKLAAGDDGGNAAMASTVAELGNAVLHLRDDPTDTARANLRRTLAASWSLPLGDAPAGSQDDFRLVLAHADVLMRLVPRVKADVRTLFSISTYDARQAIRAGQDARRLAEERRAWRFRAALYVVALGLGLRLAKVAVDWRRSLVLLRQGADAERLIAHVSTELIAAPPEAHARMLDDAVARLGAGFGADRAYLLMRDGDATRWSGPGVDWPADWPFAVLEPALARAEQEDLLDLSVVGRAAHGPLRDVLADAAVEGWCGTVLRGSDDRPVGILGFDLLRTRSPWPHGGAGMVRLAGEVLQGDVQRRRAALDRRALEERLGRAKRLEAVGAFATGIAHNVNNVIAAVMGNAEMASDLMRPGTRPAHHIGEIRRAGERAQELVSAILRFATRTSTQKQVVDIAALLDETASMLRASLPPTVALRTEIDAERPAVLGDAASLQQILMNLARNAAEAIEGDGRITMAVGREEVTAERLLSHDVLSPGRCVRVDVSDTGAGMDAGVLARVFEPFFTSRPGGTGLGLATVREIVHDHGGAIDVTSAPGRGSRFRIWIPSTRSAAATAAAAPVCRGAGDRVLLLYTDRVQLLRDEEIVAALGYEPVGVLDLEAAARVSGADGGIVLVVVDPGPEDLSLTSVAGLRAVGIAAPAVLVASRDSLFGVSDLAAAGIVAVLRRPLASAAFADALHGREASRQGEPGHAR